MKELLIVLIVFFPTFNICALTALECNSRDEQNKTKHVLSVEPNIDDDNGHYTLKFKVFGKTSSRESKWPALDCFTYFDADLSFKELRCQNGFGKRYDTQLARIIVLPTLTNEKQIYFSMLDFGWQAGNEFEAIFAFSNCSIQELDRCAGQINSIL